MFMDERQKIAFDHLEKAFGRDLMHALVARRLPDIYDSAVNDSYGFDPQDEGDPVDWILHEVANALWHVYSNSDTCYRVAEDIIYDWEN